MDTGGEFQVPGTRCKVDGYSADNNTIYEFHGCYYHGCPTCYPVRHEKHLRLNDLTFYDVYERTKKKTQTLKDLGYHVVEKWECAWRKEKAEQPEITSFVEKLNFVEPLNPRDAFSGGRTNATTLYYHVAPGEKIRYIDYTLKGIRSLSISLTALTSPPTLGSSSVALWPRTDSTTRSYHVATKTSSRSLCAPPVWPKIWRNPPYNVLPSLPTPANNGL